MYPDFRAWRIEEQTEPIHGAVLTLQGANDVYGTLEQVCGIAGAVGQCNLVKLDNCGHHLILISRTG